MLGLFRLHPQARKPFKIVFAFPATTFGRFGGHQPADGQLNQADDLAIFHDNLPAADFGQFVGSQGHILFVRADDDHLMAVMRHGGGNGAWEVESKTGDQPDLDRPAVVVALDHRGFRQVMRHICMDFAIFNRQLPGASAGWAPGSR